MNHYNKGRIVINSLEARKLPNFETENSQLNNQIFIICRECCLLLSIESKNDF